MRPTVELNQIEINMPDSDHVDPFSQNNYKRRPTSQLSVTEENKFEMHTMMS